jgi:tetratricopeptide (TPR) repeat protein
MGTILVGTLLMLFAPGTSAQPPQAQSHVQALAHFRTGMAALESERYDEAETEFRSAIQLERDFEGALYGLGQTLMRKRQYPEALHAYLECREAFKHNAAAEAMGDVVADQRLRDQIQVLKDTERALQRTSQASTPQNLNSAIQRIQSQIQLLEHRRGRREHDAPQPVPAGLSMALGSAYFRLGRYEDAEREYKAAVAVTPSFGEAHSNLAALYLVTERYELAAAEVKSAEKSGFKVNPGLKSEIEKRKKGAGGDF